MGIAGLSGCLECKVAIWFTGELQTTLSHPSYSLKWSLKKDADPHGGKTDNFLRIGGEAARHHRELICCLCRWNTVSGRVLSVTHVQRIAYWFLGLPAGVQMFHCVLLRVCVCVFGCCWTRSRTGPCLALTHIPRLFNQFDLLPVAGRSTHQEARWSVNKPTGHSQPPSSPSSPFVLPPLMPR